MPSSALAAVAVALAAVTWVTVSGKMIVVYMAAVVGRLREVILSSVVGAMVHVVTVKELTINGWVGECLIIDDTIGALSSPRFFGLGRMTKWHTMMTTVGGNDISASIDEALKEFLTWLIVVLVVIIIVVLIAVARLWYRRLVEHFHGKDQCIQCDDGSSLGCGWCLVWLKRKKSLYPVFCCICWGRKISLSDLTGSFLWLSSCRCW